MALTHETSLPMSWSGLLRPLKESVAAIDQTAQDVARVEKNQSELKCAVQKSSKAIANELSRLPSSVWEEVNLSPLVGATFNQRLLSELPYLPFEVGFTYPNVGDRPIAHERFLPPRSKAELARFFYDMTANEELVPVFGNLGDSRSNLDIVFFPLDDSPFSVSEALQRILTYSKGDPNVTSANISSLSYVESDERVRQCYFLYKYRDGANIRQRGKAGFYSFGFGHEAAVISVPIDKSGQMRDFQVLFGKRW